VIPKPENVKARISETRVPDTVLCFPLLDTMLRTVHLDDQLLTKLGKIHDVTTHRHLTSEVTSPSIKVLQLHPELDLLRGHRLA
jgi:hypothetical protein